MHAFVVIGNRHPLGQTNHRMFGDRIGQVAVRCENACHRGGVDDVAAAAFQHAGQNRAHGINVRHQIDVPLLLPDVEFGGERAAAGCYAGVVEQDVDRPKLCFHLRDEIVDRRFLADVATDGYTANFIRDFLCVVAIEIRNRYPGAAGGKVSGARGTNTASAAGDDGDLVVELHVFPLTRNPINGGNIKVQREEGQCCIKTITRPS